MQTRLPHMLAVAVGGLVGGGIIAAQYGHLVAGAGDFRRFDASSGNRLAYEVIGEHADPSAPLIVLESGHQASHRYWHWVARDLARTHRVLMYSRAGYGASEYLARGTYSLQESIDDLVDLVEYVRDGRDVLPVGHSLGGYLVHRMCDAAPFTVSSVVLIDPTHPEEIRRVPSRREGAKLLDRSHITVVPSLRIGWGVMLDTPDWLRELPASVRKALRAEFRDFGAWAATRREWDSLHQLFRSPPPLRPVTAPVSVIAASLTLETAFEQRELFEEYVAAGSGGDFRVIDGATHLTVLSSPDYATQVAEIVRATAMDEAKE